MDFSLTEEQSAVSELAGRILTEKLPADRLRQMESEPGWYADDVWRELAHAGLLGIALPEADGGGGFGILEAALVAEQIGRAVAPLPYISCIIGAGMTLAAHGTAEQRARLLPGLIDGTLLATVALHEAVGVDVPDRPATTATRTAEGWTIDGEKIAVSAADRAEVLLVPASTGPSESTVFLVDPRAEGVTLASQSAVTGEPQSTVRMTGVTVGEDSVVGAPGGGDTVVATMVARLLVGTCAAQVGVCEEALAITARYVSTREQFGSRLGTFQAVGQRVADAYIDTEAIRLTTWQAAWRLSAGLDAHDELMVAKFWAADGAQRVVHAAQHLHGGIGVDADYPIHRYFRWAKVLELNLGGATASLRRLGRSLATQGT